jgi:hypothetical protein
MLYDACPPKISIAGGRYAILRKVLFFSKKFINCGAPRAKTVVSE